MKKILFITMISLAAFLMMGCKGEANSIDKAYLRGSWQIQNIDELVLYSFGDSIFYIDENGEQIKGKWFSGKQSDSPYFNQPLVKEVEKIFNT